jgi:hypothetical protein
MPKSAFITFETSQAAKRYLSKGDEKSIVKEADQPANIKWEFKNIEGRAATIKNIKKYILIAAVMLLAHSIIFFVRY